MKMRDWKIKIAGTGSHLPGPPVSNQQLIEKFQLSTTDEWIRANLGIEERHFAPANLATSDIAAAAGFMALQDAGITPDKLERIILCSSTPDWTSPAAACNVQRILGATCPAEDTQNACASFLFGLDHAARLIATGLSHVLVIGADVKSRFVRADDRRLKPIFADGAGATVLTAHTQQGGLLDCELFTDGAKVQNMITPAGGSAMPASARTVAENLHTTRMQVDGKTIFNNAVEGMTSIGEKICKQCGIGTEAVDLLIPHQANIRIMRQVAQNLRIPEEKVVVTINKTANIVSGTVPFALDEARRTGLVKPGMIILMLSIGAGYSSGAALYQEPYAE